MSCFVPYDSLQETLLSAYRNDFNKFKELSAVVDSVMNTSLAPEAKIHAIWFYAGFVDTAAQNIKELQTEQWSQGTYRKLHNYLKPFLNGKEEFNYETLLEKIKEFFPVVEPDERTIEEKIIDNMNDVLKVDEISLLPLIKETVSMIMNNATTLNEVVLDPQTTVVRSLLAGLKESLSRRENSSLKNTALNLINSAIESITENSETGAAYVDIGNTEGIGIHNGVTIKILTKRDGRRVEVVYDTTKGQLLRWSPEDPLLHLTPYTEEPGDMRTDGLPSKNNAYVINENNGAYRLHADEVFTGISIPTENDKVQGQNAQNISNNAPVGAPFQASFTVRAHTNTVELNATRLERMRRDNPAMASRAFETMERPVQREILRNGGGPIITLYKPISGFSVRIADVNGNNAFDLDTLANLAIVYPDNTVMPFDPSNQEHVSILRANVETERIGSELFEGRLSEYKQMTDEEFTMLLDSLTRYKQFEREVMERMLQENSNNVDIKDIFDKYFSLNNNIQTVELSSDAEAKNTLGDFIKENEGALPVMLQNVDEKGTPVGEPYSGKIHVVLRNERGVWRVESTLPENTVIVGRDQKRYRSIENYLVQSEGMDYTKQIVDNFGTNRAVYISFRYAGNRLFPRVIPLVYDKNLGTRSDAVDFATSLIYSMIAGKMEKGNTVIADLNNSLWGFDIVDNIRPQFTILSQKGDEKVYGIRFFAMPKLAVENPELAQVFEERAENYDITIDKDILNEIFSGLKEMVAEAGLTAPVNASISQMRELSNEAADILGEDHPLVNNVFDKVQKMTADLKKKYNSTMARHDAEVLDGELPIPLFDSKFKSYSMFDGNQVKIKSRTDKADLFQAYRVFDMQASRMLTVTPNESLPRVLITIPGMAKAVEDMPTAPVEVPKPSRIPTVNPDVITTSLNQPSNLNDIDDGSGNENPFSLVESIEGFLTLSTEEFTKEIQAMKDLMPSAFTFVASGFEDVDVDGHALGYMQDLFIHLNNNLRAKGVAYHEGFHGIFRKVLNKDMQDYYMGKVEKALGGYKTDENGRKYITVKGKKVYADEFRKRRRYGHLNDDQIRFLIYEEYLADSFADFMDTNKPPRTWMQKLFVYLKQLLNLFKKGGRIENLFYDISLGKFRNAPIVDHQGPNMEKVYSLDFRGIPIASVQRNGKVATSNQVISSDIVIEVRDKVLQGMAALDAVSPGARTASELFEEARAKVLKSYDIGTLTSQAPALSDRIVAKYGDEFANARWLLGGLLEGQPFSFKNFTNDKQWDSQLISSQKQLDVSKANLKSFKGMVLDAYKQFDKLQDIVEEDDITETLNKEDEDVEIKDSFYEGAGFVGVKRDEGSSAFRKMFKLISYEETDPVLGIKVRRMVDSSLIFDLITKVSSTLPLGNAIKSMHDKIQELDFELKHFKDNIQKKLANPMEIPYSYYKMMRMRDQLKAVYNTLDGILGLTTDFEATKNDHIIKQFTKVFANADAHLIQADLFTDFEFIDDTKKLERAGPPTSSVSDIVLLYDINKVRNSLKDSILAINMPMEEAKPALDVLKAMAKVFNINQNTKASVDNMTDLFFKADGMFNDVAFREYVDNVYVAMSKFNLDIPYTVLYNSLGYMVYRTMGSDASMFPASGTLRQSLRANKEFFSSFDQILMKDGFWHKTLVDAIQTSIETSSDLKMRMSDETLNTAIKRFTTPYINAFGEYIIKNDPTVAGSSTKNANGDTVNKYVPPNREMLLVQMLHSFETIDEGLAQVLNDGFAHFYENNPMLDTNDPKVRVFLENLKMEVFAGFQQQRRVGEDVIKGDPRTFKDIDDASFLLSMLALFVSQRVHPIPGSEENITTFRRILTVYEATGTSMVTTGVLKRYFNNQSADVIMENGRPSYVWDLVNVLKQEYELMRHNYATFDDPNTKKLYKYNVNLDKDRGFNFNVLADFAEDNPDLALELKLAAKEGVSFDAIMAAKSEKVSADNVLKALHAFGTNQYKTFRNKFDELGLDTLDVPRYVTDVYDEDSQIFRDANPESVLREFFFNNWINSLAYNQIFDGPIGVSVKNFADFFKRQKFGAGSGPSLFNPHVNKYGMSSTYRAAVIEEVVMYLDNSDLTRPLSFTPYYDTKDERNVAVKVADGQSYNTIMRMMDVADSRGRLDNEAFKLLKRMMFETEDTQEYAKAVRKLNKNGIVFNSLKTVTAGRLEGIKQSEHSIIRKDVSTLKSGLDYDVAMQELDVLYDKILDFNYRLSAGKDDMIFDPETNQERSVSELYAETVQKAHSYFDPIPQRAFWHHMLNSMELHRIEQMFDPNASKKMTPNPVKVELQPSSVGNTYFNLNDALFDVPKALTFIQVSTEKDATMVTQGIQQKLLLVAGLDPESEDYKDIAQDIRDYREGLSEMVKNQLKVLQRMFDTKDDNVVGKIYEVISAGLIEQGQDTSVTQYFELNPDGSPKYNPNHPVVQGTIAYYFFSIFNNNLFDKKIAGRKYYHVSPLGYNVMEVDGKVITTSEYKKNKSTYDKALEKGTAKMRPLNFTKTQMKDGSFRYEVEVIVPKELRSVDQEFLENYLNEFFGTRIPTEGRRSMVVAKVVDYIDEAYGSGIIVPSQVHLLSGSDFDIDAFYAHVKSSYRTPDKNRVLYGNYSYYKEKYGMSQDEAEFLEYLIYMSNDPMMGPLLKSEMRRIRYQSGYRQEQADNFGKLFGGSFGNFFTKNASLMTKEEGMDEAENEAIETFKKLIATYNVLQSWEKSGLPSSPSSLKTYTRENGSPVIPLTQNKILKAKMNILANEKVFQNSMQDPKNRADVAPEDYAKLVGERGKDETSLYRAQNVYSPTAMLVARSLNSESKDSVGISASFNKGVSMLVTILGELKNATGFITTPDGRRIATIRTVADAVDLVGGYIGVSTDAPKNPYPGPLHLNSHTGPVMLAMFTMGYPKRGAIMFQSLPIIQKLVKEYTKEYGSAYKKSPYVRDLRFDRFLEGMIGQNESNDNFSTRLRNAGLLIPTKSGAFVFNKEGYTLKWTDKVKKDNPDFGPLDQPLDTYGFELTDLIGIPFEKDIEEYILMNEFLNYSNLASSISFRITKLTDSLKGIRPDMDSFDRLLNLFTELKTQDPEKVSLWTEQTINGIFDNYPVLDEAYKALRYMDTMSRKVLLERSSFIRGMSMLLSTAYGYDTADIRKDIKSFMALQLQRYGAEKNPQDMFNSMFLEQLDPEKFLSGDVIADFNQLRSRYPTNKFLQALRKVDIGTTTRPATVLEAIASKLSPEQRGAVYADLLKLLGEGYAMEEQDVNGNIIRVADRERALRIAYHGLIKSGAQRTRGGFAELLPAILSNVMSKSLDSLQQDLTNLDKQVSQGMEADDYIRQLNAIVSQNFDGTKASDLIRQSIAKILNMRITDGTLKVYKNTISAYKLEKALAAKGETVNIQDVINFVKKISPSNASVIINEKGQRPTLKEQPAYQMNMMEYELFTPKDGVVNIDLSGFIGNITPLEQMLLKGSGIRQSGNMFTFPLYKMNAYNQLMVIKSVDNESLDMMATKAAFGEFAGIVGRKAVYEVVNQEGTSKVSPLAFNAEEAAMIKNIVHGVPKYGDTTLIDTPISMNIVRDQNRMYELREQEVPSGFYLNRTMISLDFTRVQTTDNFSRFKMIEGSVYQYPKNTKVSSEIRLVKPEQLDTLAQRLGYTSWTSLSSSAKFADFMAGKQNIFLYDLNNGDTTSPTAQPVVPTNTPLAKALGSENPLVAAGVTPQDMKGNASKDIQMAQEAIESKDGQFIGFRSGTAMISSTDRYMNAWGNKANTGKYTADSVVMVSASGAFRGVTEEQITETFNNKYIPLLDKAIAAGASFRVGNQYAKGNVGDQLVANYLKKNGYMEEKLSGYSRWTKPAPITQPTVQSAEQIYSLLGNKTQSENVILPSDLEDNTTYTGKNFWNNIVPEAKQMFDNKINRKTGKPEPMLIAYRGNSKKSFYENYKQGFTVGNPFNWQDQKTDRKEAGIKTTKMFIEWLITGNNFGEKNATEEYRQAIINDIKSGKIKNSPILYYEEKSYATHATALDYLINKYNWEQPTTQPIVQGALPGLETTINIYAGTGENAELSNFADRPFTYNGTKFQSVEQAFQYAKGEYYNEYSIDPSSNNTPEKQRDKVEKHLNDILNAKTGAEAKALGRKNIGVDFENTAWDEASSDIMKKLLIESFKQNPNALSKLLATGTATLTHNQDKSKWGKEFPKLLMEARSELRTTKPTTAKTETVEYKYYGSTYQIEVVDGVATNVIGYKGKAAAKKKLLDAFTANPNVDPQSGKPFKKDIIPPAVSKEPVVGKSTYTFKDGFTVDVPFELNQEQKDALSALEDFVNNKQVEGDFITLTGPAGTGKSTVISLFSKYIKKKYMGVKYTSPTHRANAVTKMMNKDANVMTLHKLFNLGPNIDIDKGNYDLRALKFEYDKQKKKKLERGDILIIDEASMMNDALYEFVRGGAEELGVKVVFVGDAAQLKPVKQVKLSKAFDGSAQKVLALVKVERTGDNAVLEESVRVREGKPFSYKSKVNEKREGVVYLTSTSDTMSVAVTMLQRQANLQNKLYFRVLSAKNQVVDAINKSLREALYPDNYREQIVPGELIMGYDNWSLTYSTGEHKIHNGGDYEIISVTKDTKTISEIGHTFQGYTVAFRNALDPSAQPESMFVVDNNESVEKVQDFADKIQSINIQASALMKAGQHNIAAQMFGKANQLQSQIAVMKDFVKIDPVDNKVKTIMRRTIDYGYAHTIHKSQGGTYDNVLILDDTISAPFDLDVQRQLAYVAVSRARKLAFIRTTSETAMSQENKAFDIQKLNKEIDDVIQQKEQESRNCNG